MFIRKVILKRIIISHFMSIEEAMSLQLEIENEDNEMLILNFTDVKKLCINPNDYVLAKRSSIIIEDISNYQWENINHKVQINEDVMSFYCEAFNLYEA